MKATAQKPNRTTTNTTAKKDTFIERILQNIDQVNENDWENYTNLKEIIPYNLFTKKRYTGYNIVALFLDTIAKGFTSAKYATFNSISKAGGKLKKGAKGCVIEFFTFIYKDQNGKIIPQKIINTMSLVEIAELQKIVCIKNYVVFNSEYIENINELNFDIEQEDEEPQENELVELQNCENFINKIIVNGNLNLQFGTRDTAFYAPLQDYVELPKKEFFISTEKYYSTLFHEIIHWTGHEKRLNRNLKGHNDNQSYSFEELIAEMGAMLCSLQFGLFEEFINSLRYLKFWSNVNNQDREIAIRKAFTDSKKAKKYLETF